MDLNHLCYELKITSEKVKRKAAEFDRLVQVRAPGGLGQVSERGYASCNLQREMFAKQRFV